MRGDDSSQQTAAEFVGLVGVEFEDGVDDAVVTLLEVRDGAAVPREWSRSPANRLEITLKAEASAELGWAQQTLTLGLSVTAAEGDELAEHYIECSADLRWDRRWPAQAH